MQAQQPGSCLWWAALAGHKRSLTTRSELLFRCAQEGPASGDESEPRFDWTRPQAVLPGGLENIALSHLRVAGFRRRV